MPDLIDSAIDAALPAAVEAAAVSSTDKADTAKGTTTPKAEPSGSAAASAVGATPTPASSTIDAATTRPSASDGKPTPESDELTADEQTKGVPPERHRAIVNNTREKTEARVFQEIGYTRDEIGTLKPHMDALNTDAAGYYRWLGHHLRSNGMLQDEPTPQQPAQTTAPAAVTERPKPDLRAEDGTLAYSADAMERLREWDRQDLMKILDQRFGPLEEVRQEMQTRTIASTAERNAQATFALANTWEGFEELRPQIREMMLADKRVTLQSAYLRLHPEWSKANRTKLAAETREKTLAEIAAKPKAPDSVRPSAARVGQHSDRRRGTIDSVLDEAAAQFMT